MSYKPFEFVKNYVDRLQEYDNILGGAKASQVETAWQNHIEFGIEKLGWKALWKIPLHTCTGFGVTFPCLPIVMVLDVNTKQLTCLVSVSEVEDDDIHLPEKIDDVPLIELYPTKEQDSSTALSMYETAQLIDSLRFFYNNLWKPWDVEFDEDGSWVESHLEGRLNLHYMIMERKVSSKVTVTIRKLLSEGHKVKKEIEDLEELLALQDEDIDRLLQLTKLHNQLCDIRNQCAIYEKPQFLRTLFEMSRSEVKATYCGPRVFLVLSMTTPEQLIRLGSLTAESVSDNKQIRLIRTLQEAVVEAVAGDTVWITRGEHSIRDLASLGEGGNISGLEPGVVVSNEADGCSSLDVVRGSLSLSALTLHITTAWNIIKMWPNVKCCLTEVRLEGSKVLDGIDVLPGAKLTATNCHFISCNIGIKCDYNTEVRLTSCSFTDNNIAIKLSESCAFYMKNCTIRGSRLCAVRVMMPAPTHSNKASIENINCIPQMKESGTICESNTLDLHFVQPVEESQTNNITEV